MKKVIILMFILICVYSCKQSQSLISLNSSTLYEVKKISREESVSHPKEFIFVIEVQRNDSIFYILERDYHPKLYYPQSSKLQVGKTYKFDLSPLMSQQEVADRMNSPFFAINYLDYLHSVNIQGLPFNLKWNVLLNSYTTRELKSLYYVR